MQRGREAAHTPSSRRCEVVEKKGGYQGGYDVRYDYVSVEGANQPGEGARTKFSFRVVRLTSRCDVVLYRRASYRQRTM